MFTIKFVAALALATSLISGGASSACRKNKTDANSGTMNQTEDNSSADLKVIAEGSMSQVTTTFVAVIRDGGTYAALRGMSPNLPELSQQFFQSNLVVAAFLGERNTGGYSVAISRQPNGQIRIAEKAPRKDAIVTQVITSPFKVVSMAANGTSAVDLSLDEAFKRKAKLYRIDRGSFTVSGGFAGLSDTYQLNGKLQVMQLGNLITLGAAIVSGGTSRDRTLRDAATGLVKGNGFSIDRMNHGSLIGPPSGDLRVAGKFIEPNKLALQLDTGAVTVPDGYAGKGSLEAELVAAPTIR